MASFPLRNEVRGMISDLPQIQFDKVTADGINASWRLTNTPLQHGSESVFVSGLIQQTSAVVDNTDAASAKNDYQLDMGAGASLYSVGDLVSPSQATDPFKHEIIAITGSVLDLNRRLPLGYASGTALLRFTRQYTIDYERGIVYFQSAYNSGTIIGVNYEYTTYTDDELDDFIDRAIREVSVDIDKTANADDIAAERALVLVKTHILSIRDRTTKQAGQSIKIKQGSTSMDLTGASRALKDQSEELAGQYNALLLSFRRNDLSDALGEAVTGRQEYIDATLR